MVGGRAKGILLLLLLFVGLLVGLFGYACLVIKYT